MKRILALLMVVLMVFSLAACATTPAATEPEESEVVLAPAEAAEKAAEQTKDTTSISDVIRVPFGYLLDWLYSFTTNYGLALILFSLLVKIVLLPMSIKSKKSMLKMSRISPLAKALEAKYGDDKQKYQQELMALYKEEGVSTTGGCLWSFIPLLILLPLYYVIREPITYMLHNSRSVSAAIVAYVQSSGVDLGRNTYYQQLAAAGHLSEFAAELKALAVTAAANLREIDFTFLGLDLSTIPSFRFWKAEGWAEIGLFLIPLFSGACQMFSMLLNQKMNNRVVTNADGEKDEEAIKASNQTNTTMLLMMPLMSLWIGYSMPAAISIYWIAQAVFGAVQDAVLTVHFRKVYAREDEIKKEQAALRRAEEMEKERLRALRREQNPDGIMDNVSKKKLKQLEKEAAERAAKQYEAKKNPQPEKEEKLPLSGDRERPYCRGRAYDPNHYAKGSAKAADQAEQSKE